jgi:hypothetical protein
MSLKSFDACVSELSSLSSSDAVLRLLGASLAIVGDLCKRRHRADIASACAALQANVGSARMVFRGVNFAGALNAMMRWCDRHLNSNARASTSTSTGTTSATPGQKKNDDDKFDDKIDATIDWIRGVMAASMVLYHPFEQSAHLDRCGFIKLRDAGAVGRLSSAMWALYIVCQLVVVVLRRRKRGAPKEWRHYADLVHTQAVVDLPLALHWSSARGLLRPRVVMLLNIVAALLSCVRRFRQ